MRDLNSRLAAVVCISGPVLIGVRRFGHIGPNRAVQRALPRPGKLAIAVLSFVSPAGDSDYFADGMTDGPFSCLTVMSRNAVTSYKGRYNYLLQRAKSAGRFDDALRDVFACAASDHAAGRGRPRRQGYAGRVNHLM